MNPAPVWLFWAALAGFIAAMWLALNGSSVELVIGILVSAVVALPLIARGHPRLARALRIGLVIFVGLFVLLFVLALIGLSKI